MTPAVRTAQHLTDTFTATPTSGSATARGHAAVVIVSLVTWLITKYRADD